MRKAAGLPPSLGTVGDPYDNAVVESFRGRMQVELLNRKKWRTRVELANAIFEYIEGFHNRRRRHNSSAAIPVNRGMIKWRVSADHSFLLGLNAVFPGVTLSSGRWSRACLTGTRAAGTRRCAVPLSVP